MQVYYKTINQAILKEIEIFVHKESDLNWRVALSRRDVYGQWQTAAREGIRQISKQKSFSLFVLRFEFSVVEIAL